MAEESFNSGKQLDYEGSLSVKITNTINSERNELGKFGLTTGIVLGLLGALFYGARKRGMFTHLLFPWGFSSLVWFCPFYWNLYIKYGWL